MLARLEEIPGLSHADVDFSADFLRLTLEGHRAVALALSLLNSLGYGAELSDAEPNVARWYDRGSVGELSRVEAETIAERVVTAFGSGRAARGPDALRQAIAGALHAWFVSVALGAGRSDSLLRTECIARVVAAVEPLVGAADAAEIGRLLEEDMSRVHRDRG